MSFKGQIKINGNFHDVKVVCGQRYFNGIDADKFLKIFDQQTISELAKVGLQAIVDEKKGTKNGGYQKMMERFHIKRKT